MTAGEAPGNSWSVHDCGYAPLLTGGRLVKKHDPAWQMAEKTRAVDCLTELVRVRAVKGMDDRHLGYLLSFMHSHESTREYPGFPDCDITGDAGHLVRELKRMGEFPSPAQQAWLTRKQKAGQNVGVWWPCCWYSGRIDRELAAIAGVPALGGIWVPGLPPQPGQAGYRPPSPELLMTAPDRAPAAAGAPRGAAKRADDLAPRTVTTKGPRMSTLPGEPTRDPRRALDEGATGLTMPLHAVGGDVCTEIETWLRANGVAPSAVPFPLSVIYDDNTIAVCCSTGPGPGAPRFGVAREWRTIPAIVPVPEGLTTRVRDAGGALAVGADQLDQLVGASMSGAVPA